MLQDISVYYLDYSNSSKKKIYSMSGARIPIWLNGREYFIVSTCLRYEIYVFDNLGKQSGYHHAMSTCALERLLRLMCGLESEIKGETEIINQVERGIRNGYEKQTLSLPRTRALLKLLGFANALRKEYSITHNENYSTIAANMATEYLLTKTNPTVLVIGAGYMSRIFLEHIPIEEMNLIWINRNIKNIYANHADILKRPRNTKIYSLSKIDTQLQYADLIFTAIHSSRSKKLTVNSDLNNKKIIDISYPVIFNDNHEGVYNLENTKFSLYLLRPLANSVITKANHEISKYTRRYYGD